jgi:hypothetical protein
MYSKEVTAIILADWGKGASAEETMKHLKDVFGKAPCLNTIYTHRNGLTAKNLVDELLTQQKRAITKTSDEELGLKYRNELLKIFIPQMSINFNKNINETEQTVKHVIEFVDPDNPAETYPSSEVQAARRAGIIPQL